MAERRNLKLFYLDDRIPPVVRAHIDLVFDGLYGWQTHCRHILAAPHLEFDLLSADINFSEDTTDPAHIESDANTTWGLVHALAALARRQHQDRVRNHLPLAWEVRSVSPNMYRQDSGGLRVYGLLRSLAAMPKGDEDIFDCIAREYEESYPDALNLPKYDHAGKKLDVLFTEDLARQGSHNSDVRGIITRLLPNWRRRFLEMVRTGRCNLGVTIANEQLKALFRQDCIMAIPNGGPFVPIGNSHFETEYGIWLASVFADKLRPDDEGRMILPLKEMFADLAFAEDPHEPVTITEWYGHLIKLGTGAEAMGSPVPLFLQVVAQAYPAIVASKATENKSELSPLHNKLRSEEGTRHTAVQFTPRQRAMVLCFLCALSVLENEAPAKSLKDIDEQYKIITNERTWRDGVNRYRGDFGGLRPGEITKRVSRAMKGDADHELGVIWSWLSEGLARWIRSQSKPRDSKKYADWRTQVARRAPGLVKAQPSLQETLESWK